MYKIATLKPEDRRDLFLATAEKTHISEAMIEKDFWVCFTLDYLFHKSKWQKSIAFKGGTSLSKSYNLIERFSEDIDLILDWRLLGYTKTEPLEITSNHKRERFVEDSRTRLFAFLKNEFLPVFKLDMENLLKTELNIYIDPNDDGIVNFEYPSNFHDSAILKAIRLEIGALAAWTPTQMTSISSYSFEYFPNVFEQGSTEILTTTAERTFWEKATILHQEALRPENSLVPARYSRHYYDLYCMINKGILDLAIKDEDLLIKVAEFKRKFYPRGWAHYELARRGTLQLYPAEHSIKRLSDDYESMKSMIYGEKPSFEKILQVMKEAEKTINSI